MLKEVPKPVSAVSYQNRLYKASRAPDLNTRTPGYEPPQNAVDAHAHISGPWNIYEFDAQATYFPLGDTGLDAFQRVHQTIGIEMAVIVNTSCNGPHNKSLLDAIAQSKGKYRGVINNNAALSVSDYRALHECGIRGVRFNFVEHLGGAPNMGEFYSIVRNIAEAGGWHLVVHLDSN